MELKLFQHEERSDKCSMIREEKYCDTMSAVNINIWGGNNSSPPPSSLPSHDNISSSSFPLPFLLSSLLPIYSSYYLRPPISSSRRLIAYLIPPSISSYNSLPHPLLHFHELHLLATLHLVSYFIMLTFASWAFGTQLSLASSSSVVTKPNISSRDSWGCLSYICTRWRSQHCSAEFLWPWNRIRYRL